MSYNFSQFIEEHKHQLVSSDIPEYFWYYLFFKLNEETYDIADVCELQLNADQTEVNSVIKKALNASNGENIFIIDNAWTFEMDKAKLHLRQFSGLRERIATMVGIDTEDSSEEAVIESVMANLWSHGRYYDITTDQSTDSSKVWYLLDEAGTYITHDSENPTVRIVPFIYTPNGVCYSVAWFIRNVEVGERVTVNRVEHIADPSLRECIAYIWTKTLPNLPENRISKTLTPEFFTSHRVEETDPDLLVKNLGQLDTTKSQFTVFTDVSFVENSFRENSLFKLTDNQSEADILWFFDHFKKFEKLSREQPLSLVNQFPSETVMTTKDLLAALGSDSSWIPETFNLKTELVEFINYFHKKDEECENETGNEEEIKKDCPCNCHGLNISCGVCLEDKSCRSLKSDVGQVWIVKPWNLARGLGIFITQNLDQILRMVEAYPAEPKIASRYICDPVLFYRSDLDVNVKFDIRYMVLLSSVEPLKVFASKVFWLRFANKQFVLCNWDDYETHFTVMNYKENCQLKNINFREFVDLFEAQYPNYKWENVEREIHSTLKRMMIDVTRRADPMRVKHNPQSRGMYAVDLMLEWDRDNLNADGLAAMRTKVCEVNYCPDCTRAVQYNPDFFTDVFKTLFLDQPTNAVEL